jgi:hypothetical protein
VAASRWEGVSRRLQPRPIEKLPRLLVGGEERLDFGQQLGVTRGGLLQKPVPLRARQCAGTVKQAADLLVALRSHEPV